MEAEQRAAEATLRRLDEEDARDLVGQKQREEALRELAAREKEVREAMARLNEQGRGLTGQSSPGRVALLNTLTFGLVDSPVEAANRDLNRRFGRARGELERIEAEKQRVEAGRLPAGELGFVSREQRRRQTQEEMTERQARIDAFKRSERDALTLTRAQLAREEGGRDVRRRDFGRNETERLLNQQQFVTDEIARLSAKPTRTMEEQVRLVEMLGDAYRVVNALRDREADVERELGQLQSDRLRELRDSILGSGPAELLRKLAAMRTTFDQRGNMTPLTPAQYLSFSPGFRGDINQINPQFDPRKMELDEERNRLAGLATSFDDFLKQVTQISRQRIFELADPQLPAAFAAGLDAMTKSASFAAMTLDKLAESVAKLDNRLNGQAPATDGLQTGGGGQLSGKGGAAGYTRNFSGNQ
jgi:hypothetical protein